MADDPQSLLTKIGNLVAGKDKITARDRVRLVQQALEDAGVIQRPEADPFHALRNQAIEISDLDGLPTYVTVGVVLERIENGWIPALVALSETEMRALDHVLRIWEHEARRRARRLSEAATSGRERAELVLLEESAVLGTDKPWVTLRDMTHQQQAYRDRLKLPAHPHGECCTHYEEVAHAAMADTAGVGESNGKRG